MKLSQLFLAAAVAATSVGAHAVTTIGGIGFDDNAFADALYFSFGSYTTSGGSVASVLTDIDEGTYAFSFTPGANVILGFTDNNAYNGAGADLAIFELGIPDTVKVFFGPNTMSYLTSYTGFSAGGFALNVALVDFSDFGIAPGANLTYQSIGLETMSGSGTVPSLSLVGALHTTAPVPEPETYAMLLLGLGVVGLSTRMRKHR